MRLFRELEDKILAVLIFNFPKIRQIPTEILKISMPFPEIPIQAVRLNFLNSPRFFFMFKSLMKLMFLHGMLSLQKKSSTISCADTVLISTAHGTIARLVVPVFPVPGNTN